MILTSLLVKSGHEKDFCMHTMFPDSTLHCHSGTRHCGPKALFTAAEKDAWDRGGHPPTLPQMTKQVNLGYRLNLQKDLGAVPIVSVSPPHRNFSTVEAISEARALTRRTVSRMPPRQAQLRSPAQSPDRQLTPEDISLRTPAQTAHLALPAPS